MKEVIVPADDLVCLGKDKLQELIRCRECKYYPYREIYADDKMYLEMYEWCPSFYGNGFCSMAERKEE